MEFESYLNKLIKSYKRLNLSLLFLALVNIGLPSDGHSTKLNVLICVSLFFAYIEDAYVYLD